MDRGIQIVKLMNELRNMPEHELYLQLQGLNISIYTFDKNYSDLHNLINFLASDPKAEPLFWLKNRDKLMLVMRDVIRLIHNYVAASVSLIDHTRRLYDKLYTGTGKFIDYQSRIKSEFAQDPLAQFVKCLRKYCQHYKAPELDVTTSWSGEDGGYSRTVNLMKDDLMTFDGWLAPARKYLEPV